MSKNAVRQLPRRAEDVGETTVPGSELRHPSALTHASGTGRERALEDAVGKVLGDETRATTYADRGFPTSGSERRSVKPNESSWRARSHAIPTKNR